MDEGPYRAPGSPGDRPDDADRWMARFLAHREAIDAFYVALMVGSPLWVWLLLGLIAKFLTSMFR